jgi:hypothetical protein
MGLQKAQSVSRSPERKWHIVYDKRATDARALSANGLARHIAPVAQHIG